MTMNKSTNNKSIGTNIKSLVKTSINIPLEVLGLTAELANDAVQLTSATVRGVVPTASALLKATVEFGIGTVNPQATDEELAKKLVEADFADMFNTTLAKSGRAGRTASKTFIDFFEEETTTSNK
jgi:hypothetical protein